MAVTVVKAETYSMPMDLPPAFYTAEHVDALVATLSTGIASVAVRLDSETLPIDALGSVLGDDSVAVMPVAGVSVRKLGLFVTVGRS